MTPSSQPAITAGIPSSAKPRDAEIDVFGLTHPGFVRNENQDQFLLCTLHKQMVIHGTSLPQPEQLPQRSERLAFLAMVADGVGGAAGGAHASEMAVKAVAEYVTQSFLCYYAVDPTHEAEFIKALEGAAIAAHDSVRVMALRYPDRKGAATTLTLAIGVWPRMYVLQVGDSRAYVHRGGSLQLITRDQTIAQDLVDRGVLGPGDRPPSLYRHVLSSAIGSASARPVVTKLDSSRDAIWLLCTDGLTLHVPDERIADRLAAMESSEQACRALLQDALDGGGTDNITVIIGRVRQ